jgi:chemosensory pili system protein ChpC
MKQQLQGLRVLLLPVSFDPDPWDLLLPAAAVAEVVRAQPLEAPVPGTPRWLCGYLAWRGLRVPLVRPTALTRPTAGEGTGRAYAAVCFAPAGELAAPFFAIESPGMPRLECVTPQTLSAETSDPTRPQALFIQVALRVLGRPAGLVDLDAVERAVRAVAD